MSLCLASWNTGYAEDEEKGKEKTLTLQDVESKLEELKEQTDQAALAGHNAWMLTCCALVLMMTAPGLAMFYSGLVRRKNVLGVMMQCIFLMGMMSVIWALWGYSFAFGGGGEDFVDKNENGVYDDGEEYTDANLNGKYDESISFFGNFDHFFMHGVQTEWGEPFTDENGNETHDKGENFIDGNGNDQRDADGVYTPMKGAIPTLTFMLFQGMFFIITPALICGAFAERMKFSTMAVFMLLWGTFVYCPIAHWVWGGGMLGYPDGWAGGALDFAGGTVVHISAGVSALVCALMLGKRLGYGAEDMRPHNMTYAVSGTALLWVGWFGFNAGSQLMSDGIAASAFVATHFAAAAGGLAWAAMEWNLRGKPSALGMCSGVIAGLVCITPASGFVSPMPAIFLGGVAGIVCFYACTKIKSAFGYDDSLDAFGIHGVGGTLGALLTGVFATRAVNDYNDGGKLGVIDGNWSLLGGQFVAVAVTWIFAIVMTFGILKLLDATMGLRVTPEDETLGLDLSEHGEEGYIF